MSRLKFNTHDIAVSGILLAMILFFVLVPINFIPIDLAFIPLMAVIIACQVEGGKIGVFTATAFGVASLVAAFVRPTIFSPIFFNPLVSIIPRIAIGFTCYYSYIGMRKLLNKFLKYRSRHREDSDNIREVKDKTALYASSVVSAIVAVITNTALVVSMIAAFNFGKTFGDLTIGKAFILSLLGVNFLVELGICAAVAPPIVLALRISLKKKEAGYWLITEQNDENQDTEDTELFKD